jgi:hypothetical protein
MHANNETGVIQPIADIVRAVRDHEAAAGGRQTNAQFITMRLVTMAPFCGFREPIESAADGCSPQSWFCWHYLRISGLLYFDT